MYWQVRSLALAVLHISLLLGISLPAQASATDATRLSLPKGPGSIEGLGRKFEASPATGTASYGIDIAVPPAISGFGPGLSLAYDGGGGASEIGIGWSISGVPRIRRRTDEGLPHFDASDDFDLIGMGGAPELAEVSNGTFRFMHETGAFVRVKRATDGDTWEVRTKDGTTYRFGGAAFTEAEGSNVASYLLNSQFDLHGHQIAYEWATDGNWARLTKVKWNNVSDEAKLELVLSYESRSDVQVRFSSGIRQQLEQRLKTLEVKRGGKLVRRYSLTYSEDRHSRLTLVEMVGVDGKTAMPALSFDYTAMRVNLASGITTMTSPPGRSPGEANAALSDLNGDGLPDLLIGQTGQYRSYVNQDGKSWQAASDWPTSNSPSASLGSTGVQLADLDGDGALDLVIKSGIDTLRYLPGKDASSFSTAVSIATVPNVTFEDPDVRLADMDGDRRTDIVVTTAAGVSIGYNLSGKDWSAPVTVGVVDATQSLRFSDGHTSLCDVNGDRLQDICYLRSESLVYWLGRGRGKFDGATTAGGVPTFDASDPWKLVDLDGDGWVDLVHVGVSNVSFALAKSIGQFDIPKVIEGTPEKLSNGHVDFADMNGSGTTDILWVDVTVNADKAWRYLELFPDGRAGLLSQIDNGLGRKTTIKYVSASTFAAKARTAGTPWTTRMNVGIPVLSSIEVDSSLEDPLLVSSFEYSNGTWDPKIRSFAGFGSALERTMGDESTSTLVTKTTFETGLRYRVLRGLPTEVSNANEAGYFFSRTTPSYKVRTLATATDGTVVEYGYKDSETSAVIEGTDASFARTTQTDWQYDDFGNVVYEAKWGEVVGDDVLIGNDEVIAARTYANLESDWILGRLASEEIQDGTGKRLAMRRHFYDGEAFSGLPLGEITRGDLRRSDSWIAGDSFVNEGQFDHDEHGNVVAVIDARGSRSELTYDKNHQFLVHEIRHVDKSQSLEWSATYDALFGVIASLIDPNGNKTTVTYDEFGRVLSIIKPGDTSGLPTLSFDYLMAAPLSKVTTHAREQSGVDSTLDKTVLVDGLGRERATFSESSQSGQFILSNYARLDARGNAAFVAYATEVKGTSLPTSTTGFSGTTNTRDALGRILTTHHPDGAEARVEYGRFAQTQWDENDSDPSSPHYGTPTTTNRDGLGRLRSVIELEADREITSALYSYDALGNLTTVTDALGRERSYVYDGRSRRIHIGDPNAGSWDLTYSNGNDLESRSGPDGSVVTFTHDSFGRVTEERHQGESEKEHVSARFYYDAPSSEHSDLGNAAGQLAWVEDEAGKKYFGYDKRGRVVDTVRHWSDGSEHRDWTDYDAQDRMVRRGFPNRTHLVVSYDSRGLIASVGPLAKDFRWETHGGLASVTLGNGVTDAHGYDQRQRLVSMSAENENGKLVRGFAFTLDAASRINGITDLRSNIAEEESLTATFTYDDRYRLNKATYVAGETTWDLDDVAKNLKVTSTFDEPHLNVTNAYGEDNAKPDQLTKHGSESLKYDAAGRVTKDGERTLTWDAKGRLAKAVRGATTEEYVYGHDDQRALKKTTRDGGTDLVRYIAEDVEERDGSIVRYAYLGEQRLARLDATDAGKRTAPVTTSVASAAPTGGSGDGLSRLVIPTRFLWSALAAAFVVAIGSLLRRAREVRRFGAAATGVLAVIAATVIFIACGSDGKSRSTAERVRAESVEVTEVPHDAEFYLADAQQTAQVVVQTDGSVRSRSLFHAYGQVRHEVGQHTDPFGYVGNEEDRGSGLSDFGARPYRPEIGAFLAVDPVALFAPEQTIGNPAKLFAYAYAGGDPINESDPSGLTFGQFLRGIGAGAVDLVRGAANTAIETAKSDVAMVAEGRLADFAKTVVIDRAPIVTVTKGVIGAIQDVANFGDDVAKAVFSGSDYEAGRLALKPILTAMNTTAAVLGAAGGAGKQPAGRGVKTRASAGGGGAACINGNCGGPGVCFVAGTLVATERGLIPIEQLRLGQRVETGNADCDTDRLPGNAITVSLVMPNPAAPQDTLYLDLVRPAEWLASVGLSAEGESTWLDLADIGVSGWATVTAISQPPLESSGSGCLVLMTVRHVASELLQVRLLGGVEPIVVTPVHRLYVEEQGWTEARDLVAGALLRTDGGSVVIDAIERVSAGRVVYNVEVARDHAYRVSTAGVWAHNQCGGAARGGPTVHPGQQGKHIAGHNNFKPGRSELTHPDPQALLDKGAGTGIRHGTKEVTDFGEEIGTHVAQDGTRTATSRGTIHYNSKNEAHIVPALPEPLK